ncbi:phage virion morphogenesis protein [Alloyangia pacifica]|uniref:Phage virion morphogenesis protein n=1 Tax=Alloyangia pacifica TaxID=311180 RepID=A0A2U8HAR7_9RHOB|nr:phage virion morphogenesis protein [Alloyangia pacifica]AWI83059.1 phage virion morphogenesis protein [Alloyangia pacifica]
MIRVDLTTNEISAALKRVSDALSDLSPLMQDIGEYMVKSTKDNFADAESPDGKKWAPRKQSTMDAYARRKDTPGPTPLIGPTKSLSGTISYEASGDSVEWGSKMIYAAVQQFGAEAGEFGARMGVNKKGQRFFMPIPWGNIPARPFLGIGREQELEVMELVAEHLANAAR